MKVTSFVKQLTRVEWFALFLALFFFVSTNFVLLKISANKLAIDDQVLEIEMDTSHLVITNKETELKINELTTYDRIISQANASGMGPNPQNIRTVKGDESE